MSPIIAIPDVDTAPPARAILAGQGLPDGKPAPAHIETLVESAAEIYARLTRPRGLWTSVTIEEYAGIYPGDGQNEPETPVAEIYPRAAHLALFAVTLGAKLCDEIGRLFSANEPALGYMLDAIASYQADAAAHLACLSYLEELRAKGRADSHTTALPYSPGYCGWHVSGQRKLFARLEPEQIGITLNESCLMQPLKSVSGVFLAGPAEVHDFEDGFSFCLVCPTRQCRDRIASIQPPAPPSCQGGE